MTNPRKRAATPPPFDYITKNVPFGYCHCGCGQKTRIEIRNRKQDGILKGQPVRFKKGHEARIRVYLTPPEPNPSGICMCGCGKRASISSCTNMRLGTVKGKPSCFAIGHRMVFKASLPVEPRFWERVAKSSGCWVWTSTLDTGGYGQLSVNGTLTLVHRISWEMHYGPIPEGVLVLHKCDNPPCVRPDHLFLGDDYANIQDRNSKGRQTRGENHPHAKLTDADVIRMRKLQLKGYSMVKLSTIFKMSYGQVYMICKGRLWKHLL